MKRLLCSLVILLASTGTAVAQDKGCKMEMGGLNSRIEWERVSATDLLLYVPYTMKISDCVASEAGK